ncbi:MAG: hypothetical protein V3V28_09170 [Polaribacter sp.]|uniref:hypothetical protein n=1 Tax=Polaribacter sp. TaxID=1920175 RepID=UPI002F35866C
MKKGILLALSIYFIGFGVAWLIYMIFGHPYIHAPGFHHLMILLTFIVGVIWTIGTILQFFLTERPKKLKGFIITNLFIITCFILYISYTLKDINKIDVTEKNEKNEISTEIKGDTIRIYHNSKVVYLKIKDSVLIENIEIN